MRNHSVIAVVALCAVALACSKNSPGEETDQEPTATATPSTPAPPPPPPKPVESAAEAKPTAELQLASVGNTMLYDKTTLTVAAGQPVHLTFHNNSTQKLLPHNWVLLAKPGIEATIAAAGLAKGADAGYLDVPNDDILAYTPMAEMGTTVEVKFTAPATPGTYPYICTVPGHYMKMKGKLIVTP